MKYKNKNGDRNTGEKYKNGLRLWVVLGLMGVVGACAYDPVEVPVKEGVESQSKNDPDKAEEVPVAAPVTAPAVTPEVSTTVKPPEEIPFDIVVSERFVLTSTPEKIRRLTIIEGAVLATNGQAVNLVVQELVSQNGTIDTTPTTAITQSGAKGASGGLLHIKASVGRGRLTIIGGGQAGATGQKGGPGNRGGAGGRGGDAAVSYTTECYRTPSDRLAIFEPFVDHHPCIKSWFCSRDTGDGAQGGIGGTGQPGLAGGDGGDSSPVLVEIADPKEIVVSSEARPGKGGIGGPGGDGGMGGPGGAPGTRDSQNLCRTATWGGQGARGAQGPQGSVGKDGIAKPICLQLGNAQVGDCRDFSDLTQRGDR